MKNRKIAKRKRGGRKTQKQEDEKRLADEQARKQEDENVRLMNKPVNNKKSKTSADEQARKQQEEQNA